MNRFGFIIHPISVADVARKYPVARFLPGRLVESVVRRRSPVVVGEMSGIRSTHDGSEVSGVFVACPLTTRTMLTEPPERTLPVIIAAAQKAASEGARIVGLGAMTSVVGDAGITVSRNVDIAVTTGNSYTVATALQGARRAAELMHVDVRRATVAIIGATGSIGRTCAQIMAAETARVVLVIRDVEKAEALASELRATPGCDADIVVSNDLDAVLPTADILVCVSASADALVQPRHLKPGAVVCDVARPRDVSVAVARERDDVLVIEGGVVRPPGDNVDLGFNFGFPAGMLYACMAETSLLALLGRYENYSLGRELEPAKVLEIAALAELHGYRLAGFRSFERAVADADIEAIRLRAARHPAPA
jgi:predicted amino acid dehydrogenase